jgi:hypothetical protein
MLDTKNHNVPLASLSCYFPANDVRASDTRVSACKAPLLAAGGKVLGFCRPVPGMHHGLVPGRGASFSLFFAFHHSHCSLLAHCAKDSWFTIRVGRW